MSWDMNDMSVTTHEWDVRFLDGLNECVKVVGFPSQDRFNTWKHHLADIRLAGECTSDMRHLVRTETTNTNHLVATASHNRLSSGVRQHGPFKFNVPKLPWSHVEALTELKTLSTGAPALHSQCTFTIHVDVPVVHHFLPSPDPTHF